MCGDVGGRRRVSSPSSAAEIASAASDYAANSSSPASSNSNSAVSAALRLSDNEISAILSLPMDMVTDDGGGGGGGGGGCPDDEATRRALLHMSKVGAGLFILYLCSVNVIGSKYECALSCFLLRSHLASLTVRFFVSCRIHLCYVHCLTFRCFFPRRPQSNRVSSRQ